MPKKQPEKKQPKNKKRNSDYKPVFTDAEHKLMLNYGVGNLVDEVGVNRIMLLRTLNKMNEVREELTFRDHLDAMRAVSYTTGRIAQLLDARERLSQPYLEVEKRHQEYVDEMNRMLTEFGISFFGEEKWSEMEWTAIRKVMSGTAAPKKRSS